MDVLRSQHLEEEGLLRIPGNQQKVNQLQKEIESHCKGIRLDPSNRIQKHILQL